MSSSLIKTITKQAKLTTSKIGKDINWLRYATKTKHGYRFLSNKQAQWKTLEKIANQVHKKLSQYHKGEIVDTLSELVNR